MHNITKLYCTFSFELTAEIKLLKNLIWEVALTTGVDTGETQRFISIFQELKKPMPLISGLLRKCIPKSGCTAAIKSVLLDDVSRFVSLRTR